MKEEKKEQAQQGAKKKSSKLIILLVAVLVIAAAGVYGAYRFKNRADDYIRINSRKVELTSSTVELSLLTVENGITVSIPSRSFQTIYINGEKASGDVYLDITSITRGTTISVTVTNLFFQTTDYVINLMPSTFPDYTVEGESLVDGDYYMSTYDSDEGVNYIFKLSSTGDLIFYKNVGKKNALDFRKYYNSDGEVRYTYLKYMQNAFYGIGGINPGCVVVMDENYKVIDKLYYTNEDGSDEQVDPHGFIYIDDGHYILTSYQAETLDVPEDIGATDNNTYVAVLYVQEIIDGEVVWTFTSKDYDEFLYATTEVTWDSTDGECFDYVHFNSMYIDQDDNLLMSFRNSNCIVKVSRETGELMWILGGGDMDMFGLTEDQLFSKQHSIIVTDDGSYMIFNNGNDEVESGAAEYSSVMRFKVDESTMTITEFTSYSTEFYSNYMGAIRELDSDLGVYLWSVGGNYFGLTPDISMAEYTEDGGASFIFRWSGDNRLLYCANKCK